MIIPFVFFEPYVAISLLERLRLMLMGFTPDTRSRSRTQIIPRWFIRPYLWQS
jgi:hypothetical protein